MCDIQYEEFDNKESIYQEFKDMLISSNDEIESVVINNSNDELVTDKINENSNSKPIRISDLYSNFSSSWKNKLLSRPVLVDCSVMSNEIEEIDTMKENKEETINENSDIDEDNSQVIKNLPVNNVSQKENESVKNSSTKKVLVDSCCDSFSESITTYRKTINKVPVSKNVAVASFSCYYDDNEQISVKNNETKTTSTETETETTSSIENTKESFSNQANEIYTSLEEKILPFIKNAYTVELKLKGRLSVFQNACIKQIANQHNLMIKAFGKGRDSFILLRKKIELLNSQKEFLERKKNELKNQQEKAAKLKAKQERLLNPPKAVSSGCQVDFLTEENAEDKETISKRAARRNRKKQWELKQKQKLKRNSGTQTIADGHYVCPYCEDDIPEVLQFIHYPHCLEKYRSSNQSKSKAGNTAPSKSLQQMKKHRSKSRDKINHSKLDDLKKELDKVHNNDINTILNIFNELDKKCSVSGCNMKKKKTCSTCSFDYCDNHFSPEDKNSDLHFNCPVVLEKMEFERQKKLGLNNPLLKTVEQLRTPQFSDGSMIKNKKRVQIIPKEPETFSENSKPNISVSDINQTRTRNGPILLYERNNLRKELREKISYLSDKRSK